MPLSATPIKRPHLAKAFFHETILWALGSLFLATTGNPIMIVVNIIRFTATLWISFYQNRAGGAKLSATTPYFAQLAIDSFNALMSMLEVSGIIMGTATAAEAIYRSKLYMLNGFFYISAGLNDTKYANIVVKTPFLGRVLLNPNVWMGPICFISFSYAFTPLIQQWGNLPLTSIPTITAFLVVLCLSISIQSVVQSYQLRPSFLARQYGFLAATTVNCVAFPFILLTGSGSWQFSMYVFLIAIGNISYLIRNRKTPDYLKNKAKINSPLQSSGVR